MQGLRLANLQRPGIALVFGLRARGEGLIIVSQTAVPEQPGIAILLGLAPKREANWHDENRLWTTI
jgi:hypothetical protein